MTTSTTLRAPDRRELDAATARTAAAIERGAAKADIQRLAEIEEATHKAYLQRPGAGAELKREAELEAGG
jgi:hypothetical protein